MISQIYEQKLQRDFFKISILTLITTIIWIGMATYQVLRKPPPKLEIDKQLLPLTTTLELDTIETIKQRVQAPEIAWQELVGQKATASALVIETLTTPEASVSAGP